MSTFFNYDDEEPITAPVPMVRALKPVTVPVETERDTDEAVRAAGAFIAGQFVNGMHFAKDVAVGAAVAIKAAHGFVADAEGRQDVHELRDLKRGLAKAHRAHRKAGRHGKAQIALDGYRIYREDWLAARSGHNRKFHTRVWPTAVATPVVSGLAAWQLSQHSMPVDVFTLSALASGGAYGLNRLGQGRELDGIELPGFLKRKNNKITDAFIQEAFRGLKLAALKDEDVTLASPIIPDDKGKGWTAHIDLPGDLILSDVVSRHAQLEKLLGAPVGGLKITGDPTEGNGRVILQVGDKHSSQRIMGKSPLAGVSMTSVGDPIILGEDNLGTPTPISVANSHVFLAGMTQMGKSETVKAILAWLMLDPTAEWHDIDMSGKANYEALAPLASIRLSTDLDAVLEYLRWLDGERLRRAAVLRTEYPHALIVSIDEIHELFYSRHKTEAEQLLNRISRNCLAMNIYLVATTQRPDAASVPTSVMEQFGVRIGFHVKQSHTSDLIIPNGQQRKLDCARLPAQPGWCIVDHEGEATATRIYPPDPALISAKVSEALASRGGVVEKLDLTPKSPAENLEVASNPQVDRELPGALTPLPGAFASEPEVDQLVRDLFEAFQGEPRAHIATLRHRVLAKHQGISHDEIRDALVSATGIKQRGVNWTNEPAVCAEEKCETKGTHNHNKSGFHLHEIEPILKEKGII